MILKSLKTGILLATAGLLVSVCNIAHAHGGGKSGHYSNHHQYVDHTYSHQTVYVKTIPIVYPKKHYHPATAYVGAEYHSHAGSYPFHRHYYWKKPHYTYVKKVYHGYHH